MSPKSWLICFFAVLALVVLSIPFFNMATDPFGVFGDPILGWYDSNMTNNPAASKIAYINLNHQNYDSYIIGSSGASSFPVDTLNKYTGAKFFNLFSYGADMEKTYLAAKYVLENYEVKNLVLCVGIMDAVNYKKYGDSLTESLHQNITGEFAPSFYLKYLYANPKYGMAKLDYKNNHAAYLPKFFDVFDAKTGSYDDRVVDIEPIGGLERYLEAKPAFLPENRYNPASKFPYIDECVGRIAEIKELCEKKGADFKLIFMPSYFNLIEQLNMTRVAIFYDKLARVCDFWDFFLGSASMEPRYFQDYMHIRNALGNMALARVYGDGSVYIPEDFGFFVTKENSAEYDGGFWDRLASVSPEAGHAAALDILAYHHIDESAGSDTVTSPERLEQHLKALSEAGYSTVSASEIFDFVERGLPLPEKALLLTFDDGYLSNYEYAFPILAKYGMKALVCPIGISMGTDRYRNTDRLDVPYFGWDEAREMAASGIFEIGSHSYDMHLYPPAEPDPDSCRQGILRLHGESEQEYIAALRADIEAFAALYEQNMGHRPTAFAFPYGKHELLAEALLLEYGFKMTFTTQIGANEIIKGLPQSLYGLCRYTVSGEMSGAELIELLSEGK
ncbi:MAG: polysaccharide deacetylase family protein [Oscillospiraceae bacterium]|nr:polysaccharide deacetylase family protein [Oscillospiraceae bacterium]